MKPIELTVSTCSCGTGVELQPDADMDCEAAAKLGYKAGQTLVVITKAAYQLMHDKLDEIADLAGDNMDTDDDANSVPVPNKFMRIHTAALEGLGDLP